MSEKVENKNKSFVELQQEAQKRGIDCYGLNKKKLLIALGYATGSQTKAYTRPRPTPEKMQLLKEGQKQIPGNTIVPKDEYDDWMKIIEQDPFAFNGCDLTDDTAPVIHTIKRKLRCACGAKIEFPEEHGNIEPITLCSGIEKTVRVKGKTMKINECMPGGKFRKFIYHKVPN